MARGFSRGGGGGGGRSGGGFSFGGGGSRSSGGGFSFGGGSSRRSSSSSYSGGSYHHHHRPRRPWHIPMFGRTVVVSTGAQSIFSFLIIVFIFATFLCVNFGRFAGSYNMDIKDQKSVIAKYEAYDKDYNTLINGAKNGTYEIQYFDINEFYNSTTKQFTTRTHYGSGDPTIPGIYDDNFYRDNQEYFYIVFEYTYNGSTYTDFTFFQYTKYQLEDIVKYEDGKLEIAVGRLTNTASKDDGVYAINMDYSLTANQDYQYEKYLLEDYKDSRNRYLWISIIAGVVLAGIIGGVVFYLVKQYKTAQKKADAEIQKTEAETKLAEEKAKQMNRTCEYCGCDVPDGADVCPGCGSRFFE